MLYSNTINKNKILNIGILGSSSIASRKIIPAILNLPEKFKLLGIASRSVEKSIQFANKFNCNFYPSYESLLNDDSINAIYIPLPNFLHYEWAKKSLQKGINVLIEKPATLNLKDTDHLIKIASNANLSIVETFQFRFHKQFNFLKNFIKSKEIGDIRFINSSFGFPKNDFPENIRYRDIYGGGSLLDAGVYPLKISDMLIGPKLIVKSSTLVMDKKLNIDMWGCANLQSIDSEVSSNISFGFDNHYRCNIDIWGSKGSISTGRIFTAPADLETKLILNIGNNYKEFYIGKDDHFKNLLIYFYNSVFDETKKKEEYKMIHNQARLISEIQENSNLS